MTAPPAPGAFRSAGSSARASSAPRDGGAIGTQRVTKARRRSRGSAVAGPNMLHRAGGSTRRGRRVPAHRSRDRFHGLLLPLDAAGVQAPPPRRAVGGGRCAGGGRLRPGRGGGRTWPDDARPDVSPGPVPDSRYAPGAPATTRRPAAARTARTPSGGDACRATGTRTAVRRQRTAGPDDARRTSCTAPADQRRGSRRLSRTEALNTRETGRGGWRLPPPAVIAG